MISVLQLNGFARLNAFVNRVHDSEGVFRNSRFAYRQLTQIGAVLCNVTDTVCAYFADVMRFLSCFSARLHTEQNKYDSACDNGSFFVSDAEKIADPDADGRKYEGDDAD